MIIWIVLIVPQNVSNPTAMVDSVFDSAQKAEQQKTDLINTGKWIEQEIFLVQQNVQS